MFTGIIEQMGVIVQTASHGSGKDFWIEAAMTSELKPDQSVAHNGVCLTVVEIQDNRYLVTAVEETLAKTALGEWRVGDVVNLERSLRIGDRLDGHFVQGHVDTTATCIRLDERNGSHVLRFQFPPRFAALVIEKGSICLNGVSLTVFDVTEQEFSVTIIPFTWQHTNLHLLQVGQAVNIEFDVLGKYLLRRGV